MRFMATENDMKGVIEPLASYICATDQPKAALVLAVEILLNEVEQMNRTARAYIATSST
jgi:hypothetical protein